MPQLITKTTLHHLLEAYAENGAIIRVLDEHAEKKINAKTQQRKIEKIIWEYMKDGID